MAGLLPLWEKSDLVTQTNVYKETSHSNLVTNILYMIKFAMSIKIYNSFI